MEARTNWHACGGAGRRAWARWARARACAWPGRRSWCSGAWRRSARAASPGRPSRGPRSCPRSPPCTPCRPPSRCAAPAALGGHVAISVLAALSGGHAATSVLQERDDCVVASANTHACPRCLRQCAHMPHAHARLTSAPARVRRCCTCRPSSTCSASCGPSPRARTPRSRGRTARAPRRQAQGLFPPADASHGKLRWAGLLRRPSGNTRGLWCESLRSEPSGC